MSKSSDIVAIVARVALSSQADLSVETLCEVCTCRVLLAAQIDWNHGCLGCDRLATAINDTLRELHRHLIFSSFAVFPFRLRDRPSCRTTSTIDLVIVRTSAI